MSRFRALKHGHTTAFQKKHSTDSRIVHPTMNPHTTLWADMAPPSWRPFVQLSRVDMLAGSLLQYWPFMWGILASAYRMRISPLTAVLELFLYFFGSVVLHSAACTWNDVCDMELDAKVERTKYRPLAAGTMSVKAAMIFLVPQLTILLGLLLLTNTRTVTVALLGHSVWHPAYPFMKRVTYWPQAWLGCLCNWNFVIAWMTNTQELDLKILTTLFFGGWCWTMHCDSIYGMQDKDDDAKLGVKSTALLFGTSAPSILAAFCTGFVLSLTLYGVFNNHGPAYFLLTVLGTAVHLVWQIVTLDMDDPRNCFARFDANGRHLGLIVGSGMAVDYVLNVLV